MLYTLCSAVPSFTPLPTGTLLLLEYDASFTENGDTSSPSDKKEVGEDETVSITVSHDSFTEWMVETTNPVGNKNQDHWVEDMSENVVEIEIAEDVKVQEAHDNQYGATVTSPRGGNVENDERKDAKDLGTDNERERQESHELHHMEILVEHAVDHDGCASVLDENDAMVSLPVRLAGC